MKAGKGPLSVGGGRRTGGTMVRGLVLSLTALLAGCGLLEPDSDDASADLERARGRWEAAAIQDYRLTIERFCFCALVGPVHVLVEDGQAVAVVPEDDPAVGVTLADYPPVEGLFDIVEDAIGRRAHRLMVVYHPSLGYPTEIEIDYREYVDDEEVALEVALHLDAGSALR